jgi:basic membrane lipoprotein Med (substrate-binding protein (PBP1-ABC) superfamily)
VAFITALGVAGAGAAALIIGFGGHPQALTVTDISQNFKVCMLATGNSAAPVASPAWTAVSDAARQTKAINAEQLTAPAGPARQQIPYLNSLVSLRCRLIVVVGPGLRDALAAVAKANPAQRFLSYGTGALLPNIHQVPDGDTAAIATAIIAAAKDAHARLVIIHH